MEGEATQHKNAINDETFVFECKGYGYPRPVVTWMRGNSSLDIDTSDTPRVSVKNSTFMDNAILKIKVGGGSCQWVFYGGVLWGNFGGGVVDGCCMVKL